MLFPVMLMALRVDNLRMERMRVDVFTADEAGDYKEIERTLNELLRFSSRHMNANTGVFYLQHSYDRAVEAAAKEMGDVNIHRDVARHCERLFNNRWSLAFVDCMVNGLAEHPGGSAIVFPEPALFRYEFVSPPFSFSVAGIVSALWFLMALLLVVRLVYYAVLRVSLEILKKKEKTP